MVSIEYFPLKIEIKYTSIFNNHQICCLFVNDYDNDISTYLHNRLKRGNWYQVEIRLPQNA